MATTAEAELAFPTAESYKTWFAEKTRDHPLKTGRLGRFYEEFAAGDAPVGLLQDFAKQYYIFIQLTNANTTWWLARMAELWRQHPELYDIVADKMGVELTQPAPGGHGRTYLKYARYLGLKDEDLFCAKPIPELEIRCNQAAMRTLWTSPVHIAVSWMLEGFVGYDLLFWRNTLHEKYGAPDDVLEYFDIHVIADLEVHGPEGEMLLDRVYELGLVQRSDYPGMRLLVERAVEGAHPGSQNYWRDAIYDRYYQTHPR